jgi:hypothetical protein
VDYLSHRLSAGVNGHEIVPRLDEIPGAGAAEPAATAAFAATTAAAARSGAANRSLGWPQVDLTGATARTSSPATGYTRVAFYRASVRRARSTH